MADVLIFQTVDPELPKVSIATSQTTNLPYGQSALFTIPWPWRASRHFVQGGDKINIFDQKGL